MSKKQGIYNEEFKRQIVNLFKHGKSATEISKEYGIAKSSVHSWVKYAEATGSFKIKDNRSCEENELILLRKENKRLLMENDILKQAALLMAKR